MNALKYHWFETSSLSQAFLRHVVSTKISSSRSRCKGPVLYLAKTEEIYGIVSYQKTFHVMLKKKTSTCGSQVGHMWVTSGLFCAHGSRGQMGQQVRPPFNPGRCLFFVYRGIKHLHGKDTKRPFLSMHIQNTHIN